MEGITPPVILAFALLQSALAISVLAGEAMYFVGFLGLLVLAGSVLVKMEYGLYALPIALATPLQTIPGSGIHLGEVVIFLMLCSLFGHVALSGEIKGLSFPRKYVPALILLVGANLASLSHATYPVPGMINTAKLIIAFLFVFGITYHQLSDEIVLRGVSRAITIAGLVAALYGILQYYLSAGGLQLGGGPRIFGAIGSVYGAFIGASIANVFSHLLTHKGIVRRIPFVLMLAPLAFALYISRTRAWILGTLLALLMISLLWAYKKIGFRRLVVICVTLLLVGVMLFGAAQDLLLKTFTFLFVRTANLPIDVASRGVGKAPDLSLMLRYRLWSYAWKVFLDNPLTGVGASNMRIEDAARPQMSKPRAGIGYVDNHYLNILVETGVLGAAAWIYLLYLLFSASWRIVHFSDDRRRQGMCFGFIGAVIVFLTGGVFWLLTVFIYDSSMLAFLFALIFASDKLLRGQNMRLPALPAETKSIR